jgi:PAS domain S-box-containing protein
MPAERRARHVRFLAHAQSMRAQIQRFADTVQPSNGGSAFDARSLESEMRVAIEELRAQNDTLFEACTRLEWEIAKYRDLYDSAPHALVTTDKRGVIVDANRAAAALFELPHETLPGKLLIAFVARRDTSPFRARLRGIAYGPGHDAFPVQMRPRGGKPVLAHLEVRAIRASALVAGDREGPAALHWTIRLETDQTQEDRGDPIVGLASR